jgi:hypothetical protein
VSDEFAANEALRNAHQASADRAGNQAGRNDRAFADNAAPRIGHHMPSDLVSNRKAGLISPTQRRLAHAGHTGTLKQWEDSPEGQQWIAENGGTRQTPEEGSDSYGNVDDTPSQGTNTDDNPESDSPQA